MTEENKPTIEALMAQADEMGIKYPGNIGRDTLEFKIQEEVARRKEKSTESILDAAPGAAQLGPTLPQRSGATKLKLTPASVKIKKELSRKKKAKEVWLATPYFMHCTDPETGSIQVDKDGDALAIPLLTCVTVPNARKLIAKYQPKVDVDDDGDLTTVTTYQKATPEQIEAYHEEMAIRAKFRARTIRERKVRDAKHIVQVTAEEAVSIGK